MTATKLYEKVFVTGCDANTEWMLPWFLTRYKKYNKTPIFFANFGVTEMGLNNVSALCHEFIDLTKTKDKGWFKKPNAIIEATKRANKVCWIDTDCEVLGDLSGVFEYTVPGKLAMAEDRPWSSRRGETWHNTGVVAVESKPIILDEWADAVRRNPTIGDQEVLHSILRQDMRRITYVADLPQEYNWMRLLLVDGQDNKRKKIMHWTGEKGKQHIREEALYG